MSTQRSSRDGHSCNAAGRRSCSRRGLARAPDCHIRRDMAPRRLSGSKHAGPLGNHTMMMTKRFFSKGKSVALLLIIAACGQPPQGGISTPAPRMDRVHVESQHVDYDIVSTADGTEIRSLVPYPAADVWQAVPRVYADLAIPTETLDPQHRFLAGIVSARRQFANKSLSHFVNCGSTLMGPNADTYNVRLHIQTQVDPTRAGEARVRSVVQSTAASDGGTTVQCSSTGDLERSIADRVRALLIQQKK